MSANDLKMGRWAAVLCVLLALLWLAWPDRPQQLDNAALQRMLQADTIEIQDDWFSYHGCGFGTRERRYTLVREGEHFIGQASFVLFDYTATAELSITRATVESFLTQLAQTPLFTGTYVPEPTHTDDYPERKIQLQSDEGTFTFYSTSQDRNYWELTVDNKEYEVVSDNPDRALSILAPHLEPEVYDALVDELLNECKSPPATATETEPTRTPSPHPTATEGR